MIVNGKSIARGVDLFDHCGKLTLTATRSVEAELLAALVAMFVSGGRLTVKLPGKRAFVWEEPTRKEAAP